MKNNAIIFGDSYSTYGGYIPEGYAVYYPNSEPYKYGVNDVSLTWWHQVITKAGFNLVLNNSWSGSTIGHTGYNNADCSHSSSFIFRLRELIDNGFFKENEINKVFVFGGTNDSWAHVPLGALKFDSWQESDLFCVLPAICYFLNLLKETLPNADIYCLINTDINDDIREGMNKACEKYGVIAINFDSIDKQSGHPTDCGMKEIAEEVLKKIL